MLPRLTLLFARTVTTSRQANHCCQQKMAKCSNNLRGRMSAKRAKEAAPPLFLDTDAPSPHLIIRAHSDHQHVGYPLLSAEDGKMLKQPERENERKESER